MTRFGSDVHFKTSLYGTAHSYPDPGYVKRTTESLMLRLERCTNFKAELEWVNNILLNCQYLHFHR